MTLKELCAYFKLCKQDSDKCEHYKNQWILEQNHDFHFEELDETDVKELRPYLQCWVLSVYEYLAVQSGMRTADWFGGYEDVKCSKEENDYFKELSGLYADIYGNEMNIQSVYDIYDSMLNNSITQFKRRGIARNMLDDAV